MLNIERRSCAYCIRFTCPSHQSVRKPPWCAESQCDTPAVGSGPPPPPPVCPILQNAAEIWCSHTIRVDAGRGTAESVCPCGEVSGKPNGEPDHPLIG